MSALYNVLYHSPLGWIELRGTGTHLTQLYFIEPDAVKNSPRPDDLPEVMLAGLAQLAEYFAGERQSFDLPLQPAGSDFQQSVWQQLLTIPFGQTVSYLDIATALGAEKAVRAVGAANGQNPISLIIPCHRVIGRNGQLTGYGGGLWRKEWLLRHEGAAGFRQLALF
ncbi:MAG TPA: methylated-DNA--[protein]-cysteine S-methyltransferase [Anaerolineae bacterium]|nr:methylated-DNA--[protein]-cysteine S-methyltransferase [Anaerolineae bacterium]